MARAGGRGAAPPWISGGPGLGRRTAGAALGALALALALVSLHAPGAAARAATPGSDRGHDMHVELFPVLQEREALRHARPEVPSKAFLINMPKDAAKRANSLKAIEAVKYIKDVEIVQGVVADASDLGCLQGGCQLGLTFANIGIWNKVLQRNLTGAWIFEDDVVFHDDFMRLFPQYWRHVPYDYEVVYVGQCSRVPWGDEYAQSKLATVSSGVVPFCTHALIISQAGAERLSKIMEFLMAKIKPPKVEGVHLPRWPINPEDLKTDIFYLQVFEKFVLSRDKNRWVFFDSTEKVPARFEGFAWWHAYDLPCERGIDSEPAMGPCKSFVNECRALDCELEACRDRVMVFGTGLAYQQLCGEKVGTVYESAKALRAKPAEGR